MRPPKILRKPRRAQSLVETAAILGPLMLFIFGAATTFIIFFRGWTLSQAVAKIGENFTQTAVWSNEDLAAEMQKYGLLVNEQNDQLIVTVYASDGSSLCAEPVDDVCTYGWGESPEIEYGDFVTIKLVTNGNSDVPYALFSGSMSGEWSGIAQRDTGSGAFTAPETTGNLQISVRDPNGDAVGGALVTLSAEISSATDSEGKTSFADLSPGDYLIGVSAAGFQDTYGTATVTVGATASASITMSDALILNVYVGDGNINMVDTNPGLESGTTNGWLDTSDSLITTPGGGVEATAAAKHSGSYGLSFVTDSASTTSYEGVEVSVGAVTAADSNADGAADLTYYGSIWVKAPAGTPIDVFFGSQTSIGDSTQIQATATGGWQEIAVAWTPNFDYGDAVIAVRDGRLAGATAITVYVDDALVRSGAKAIAGATVEALDEQNTTTTALEIGNGQYRFIFIADMNNDGTNDTFEISVAKSGCSPETFSFSAVAGSTVSRNVSLTCSP